MNASEDDFKEAGSKSGEAIGGATRTSKASKV